MSLIGAFPRSVPVGVGGIEDPQEKVLTIGLGLCQENFNEVQVASQPTVGTGEDVSVFKPAQDGYFVW